MVWHLQWPDYITHRLLTSSNPVGTITNSDLELDGGLVNLEALVQTFGVRERTIISTCDKLNTAFWERKGSNKTSSPPAYPLGFFGMHQRYHRYVP